MKRCSTTLLINIREMQIKTAVRYHLLLVRMAVINKSTNKNVGEGVEKRKPSSTVGGNVNCCNHCGKQYGVSLKN